MGDAVSTAFIQHSEVWSGIPSREAFGFLSRMHDVSDAKRPAFQAQLYALMRAGLPVSKPGRGREAIWRGHDFMILATSLELLQMGIAPKRTCDLLGSSWPQLSADIPVIYKTKLEKDRGEPAAILKDHIFWRIHLEGLRTLARADRPYASGEHDKIDRIDGADVTETLNRASIVEWRHLLIDATTYVEFLLSFLRSTGTVGHKELPHLIQDLQQPWTPPSDHRGAVDG